jgi:hypothetical protein
LLNAPGYAAKCLNRKEIKGANVGATGTGIWQFDGTIFTISWVSPGGGRAEWISKVCESKIISKTALTQSKMLPVEHGSQKELQGL